MAYLGIMSDEEQMLHIPEGRSACLTRIAQAFGVRGNQTSFIEPLTPKASKLLRFLSRRGSSFMPIREFKETLIKEFRLHEDAALALTRLVHHLGQPHHELHEAQSQLDVLLGIYPQNEQRRGELVQLIADLG